MISLERCREILGDQSLPDGQVVSIREAIYGIAYCAFDEFASNAQRAGNEKCQNNGIQFQRFQFDKALSLVPGAVCEDIEERAAIMEYEGEIGRDEAERSAFQEYINR